MKTTEDFIQIAQGDGPYFIDYNGNRYLDFNSMAMCSSLGHTVGLPLICPQCFKKDNVDPILWVFSVKELAY